MEGEVGAFVEPEVGGGDVSGCVDSLVGVSVRDVVGSVVGPCVGPWVVGVMGIVGSCVEGVVGMWDVVLSVVVEVVGC